MLTGDVVLGIDAGTGSIRACLFDLAGHALGASDRGYETHYPRPGRAEQRPADWWEALVAATGTALRESGIDGARVIGLAVDAPCDILLADAAGTPLTDALMWMDLRGTEQARRLTATDAAVLKYCGGDVPAEWPLPKTLWLKEQAPVQWNAAARLVEQMTWLTWRLTNEWVAPLNSAAAKWHYRATTQNGAGNGAGGWPVDLLARVGLEDALAKLPSRVVPMAGKAGELSAEAAQLLGLRAGIAVAMSGIDAHAGMLGVGVYKPGAVALITGTSTCQLAQSHEAIFDRGLWGPFQDAVVPNAWTIEAGQASTGGTVRWLMDIAGARWPKETRYQSADAEAAAIAPGAEGLVLLDFWQGSRTPVKDPAARGTIWGLTNGHGAGHLLRAVYEGTAYGNKRVLEALARKGVPTERIVACGGGVRSALWLQIIADVAGVPIDYTLADDAVALGSAMCAAVGAGAFPDLATAAQAMTRPERRVEPNPVHRAAYDEGYALYEATYAALAPLFARQQAAGAEATT
jgi:FGGY-family pentulose kinase